MHHISFFQKLLLLAVILVGGLLVYSPHFSYPYPLHVDEWHHIEGALRLFTDNYFKGVNKAEVGFHFILYLVSLLFDLVLVYKFLPAIWFSVTIFTLFLVVHRQSKGNYFISILSCIFFISLKSNVNLMGPWFFTPLTFATPFVYLYVYLFMRGMVEGGEGSTTPAYGHPSSSVRRGSRPHLHEGGAETKSGGGGVYGDSTWLYLLGSLLVMLFLIPIHAISVFFAIPILALYLLLNFGLLKKHWMKLLIFLVVPIVGALVYFLFFNGSWGNLEAVFLFRKGWGILELNNSLTEVYSLAGLLLSALGFCCIIFNRKKFRHFEVYAIWGVVSLLMILIFKIWDVSFFAPYQRYMYYLALSLPVLSALGVEFVLKTLLLVIAGAGVKEKSKLILNYSVTMGSLALIAFFVFQMYFVLPPQSRTYNAIDELDYQTMLYLRDLPPGKVISPGLTTMAVYPIARKMVVSSLVYVPNLGQQNFYLADSCEKKEKVLSNNKAKYVISRSIIGCGWEIVYNKGQVIYRID